MKYLEMSYLDAKDRKELEEKGLYCYDLRHSDFGGEIACIEKDVLVNRAGSMVTDEEIQLGNKYPDDYKDYEEFIKENENVNSIEELLYSKIKKEINEILKNNEEYSKYEIMYILTDKENPEQSIALASNYDEMIEIDMKTQEINTIMDWSYNIDDDILEKLQNGKEISYMNMGTHYGIWNTVNDVGIEEIENKKGLQKYLQYCKKNNINKDLIEKENQLNEVEDIMQYYKEERKNERDR